MQKYRQANIRGNLELRSKILRAIRSFFEELDFLEVETPVRIPTLAPEVNIEPQESGDWFLQTSPELCMKRLVAAGYEKIFQLCKCFRKYERGVYHLPEITLLEWYEISSDYKGMMNRCESLFKYLASQLNCKNRVLYKGKTVDFSGSWDRITVSEAFDQYTSTDVQSALLSGRFDEIMCIEIEPQLGNKNPVFLYDYPAAMGSLARLSRNDFSIAERFELYCAGIELCNAFTELTDPLEQRSRFRLEREQRKLSSMAVWAMPEPFLNSLSDLPPVSGNAMGVDRLVMLFADAQKIDQVVAFTPEEL